MLIKPLLIFAGTLSFLIGILGIFIPVLPSTPFFIVTAGLYVRSSPRLYKKFISSNLIRHHINLNQNKISPELRIFAISVMWIMIIISIILFARETWLIILLITAGIAGTILKLKYL